MGKYVVRTGLGPNVPQQSCDSAISAAAWADEYADKGYPWITIIDPEGKEITAEELQERSRAEMRESASRG